MNAAINQYIGSVVIMAAILIISLSSFGNNAQGLHIKLVKTKNSPSNAHASKKPIIKHSEKLDDILKATLNEQQQAHQLYIATTHSP